MPLGPAKCPQCQSANVEPVSDKLWRCNDCKLEFQEAMVELLPEKNKRKEKK